MNGPCVRQATFEEQAQNMSIHILTLELPFGMKRDLLGQLMSLTYIHEQDMFDASRKVEERRDKNYM